MYAIGIDGGVDGAIAVIDTDTGILHVHDMPTLSTVKHVERKGKDGTMHRKPTVRRSYDIRSICAILEPLRENAFCVLEQASPMKDQGVTSMFSTGYCFGVMCGVLAALHIPHRIEHPKSWQKAYGISAAAGGKDKSIEVASRLFPGTTFSGPKGGKLHGRSDAALMADYARSTWIE